MKTHSNTQQTVLSRAKPALADYGLAKATPKANPGYSDASHGNEKQPLVAGSYGTKATGIIAKAFKDETNAQVHNAYTDGRSVFLFGLRIAENRNGTVYLSNGGLPNSVTQRYLEAIVREFTLTLTKGGVFYQVRNQSPFTLIEQWRMVRGEPELVKSTNVGPRLKVVDLLSALTPGAKTAKGKSKGKALERPLNRDLDS